MARRRRRSKADAVSAATLRAIKARKLSFLREVSSLLSDALGFAVRVSMVAPKPDLSPEQRRVARRSAAVNRASIAASFNLGPLPGDLPSDPLPAGLLGADDEASS